MMHEQSPETPNTGPFPADATDRREFLLRMAKVTAFAAPMVYSVSVGALPAAAMSGAGNSGNCPPGQVKNFGVCTPRGQNLGDGGTNGYQSGGGWESGNGAGAIWERPQPTLPEPGSGGTVRPERDPGRGAILHSEPKPERDGRDLLRPE